MNGMITFTLVGMIFLSVGVGIGWSLRSNDYSHGHTDGLLAGIFEEYNRAVIKDRSKMTRPDSANLDLHMDFLEKRVDEIFASTLPYSKEMKKNWEDGLKSRRNDAQQAGQPDAASRRPAP